MSIERHELDCKCCGLNRTSTELMDRLKVARVFADVPFIVTSGTRCIKHNAEVGGSPTSAHLLGYAVDLLVKDDYHRFQILQGLVRGGFKRILIYKTFIHADVAHDRVSPICKLMY